jgi:hypothetical protein
MNFIRLLRSLLRFTRTLRGAIALGLSSFLIISSIGLVKAVAQNTSPQPISQTAAAQIQALIQEKAGRTVAQRKLSSALVYRIKARRGDALLRRVPSLNSLPKSMVPVTADGRMQVEIKSKSPVTPPLLQQLSLYGATVISAPSQYNRVRAIVSEDQLENLASLPEVVNIRPFIKPLLLRKSNPGESEVSALNQSSFAAQDIPSFEERKQRVTAELPKMLDRVAQVPGGAITNAGVVTSEGDVAHGAAIARTTYGVDGSYKKSVGGGVIKVQKIKIGVLSDSYNNRGGAATDIANGELPIAGVKLVGSGDLSSGGIDEGRAMLQIIHDLAPGAELYFATAFGGEADFANNIRALRKAGCDIIVDDVFYFAEPVFQDGIIAQAVNEVTANGALYFSSAGNQGNKNDNTSGVWEGDFLSAGAAPAALGISGNVHQFATGSAGIYNTITSNVGPVILQWSDPLGQSSNDYDLYLLNPQGTQVILASTNFQNGNADPLEALWYYIPSGYKLVVVQYSGQRRYIHLNSFYRGGLQYNTPGQTSGHSAAVNAFSVAAVTAQGRTTAFTGGAANPVETFSSDGLRRVFYRADGTAITPGIFLSTGGSVRQKPDIAAADGVKTTLPSPLNPFFGTSAAAPHAGAVAALLKSYRPSLTTAEIRSILTSTALDIEGPGVDRDSGYGIVMANRALQKASTIPKNQ